MKNATVGIWEQRGTYNIDFYELGDGRTYRLYRDLTDAFGLRDKLLGEPNYDRWNESRNTLYTTSLDLAEALLGRLSSKDFALLMSTYVDMEPGSHEDRVLSYLATLDDKFLYYGFIGQMFQVDIRAKKISINQIGWGVNSRNLDQVIGRIPFWLISKSEEGRKLRGKVLLCSRVLPVEKKGRSLRDRVVTKWDHPVVLAARKETRRYSLTDPYSTSLAEASQFGIPSWFIDEEGKEVELDEIMPKLK